MNGRATVVAHPNIALAKYWGKREGEGNVPAVPSLSVTLAGMSTKTTVTFDEDLTADELVLNGVRELGRAQVRASALLDTVRAHAKLRTSARIVSENDFPTASGLASSASGFAALALAACRAAGLDWDPARVSGLARESSASAARSLFGGFVALDGGVGAEGLATPVAGPDALDLCVLVCVTTEGAKATSSTLGMMLTQRESPYYAAWVEDAPRVFSELRTRILEGDFRAVGALAERSALSMHACALAAGIVYVSGATLSLLAEVKRLRDEGVSAFATMDAGPHLKCLVQRKDLGAVKARLAAVPGVLRVLETRPGEGARVVAPEGSVAESRRDDGEVRP